MLEIEIKNLNNIEKLQTNINEVKKELLSITENYIDLVYSEDNLVDAKKDRATLNKYAKFFNDKRLEAEREYLKPFESNIKEPLNELVKIAKDTSASIDKQVKEFEEKQRQEKLLEVEKLFYSLELPDGLEFGMVLEDSYLLKSTSDKAIKESIEQKIAKVIEDLAIIQTQNPVDLESVEQYYFKNNLDLRATIAEIHRQNEIAKKIEEKVTEQAKPVFTKTEEDLQEFTLTIFATPTQIIELKEFLKQNNIAHL